MVVVVIVFVMWGDLSIKKMGKKTSVYSNFTCLLTLTNESTNARYQTVALGGCFAKNVNISGCFATHFLSGYSLYFRETLVIEFSIYPIKIIVHTLHDFIMYIAQLI